MPDMTEARLAEIEAGCTKASYGTGDLMRLVDDAHASTTRSPRRWRG